MTNQSLGKRKNTNWALTIILILLALITIGLPLYLTVVIALKSPQDMANVLALPKTIRWENFTDAIKMTNFGNTFKNTFLITILSLVLTLPTNACVAYAISRNMDKRFFRGLYYYFISAMFIPFNIIMLPLVKQTAFFNVDNVGGMVFLYVIFGLPLNTFLYTGYLKSLPTALDEAARIDGAGPFRTFFQIIFPMMTPINSTVAVLTFLWTWNDFMMPLVILSEPHQQTLQLAQYVFKSQFSTNYNLAFASYLLVLLPILIFYIAAQKWVISGVTNGAVK